MASKQLLEERNRPGGLLSIINEWHVLQSCMNLRPAHAYFPAPECIFLGYQLIARPALTVKPRAALGTRPIAQAAAVGLVWQ